MEVDMYRTVFSQIYMCVLLIFHLTFDSHIGSRIRTFYYESASAETS